MPLMSLTTCYKTLPSYFADKVTQHVRKRRQYHVTSNDGEKDDTDPCFTKGHISTTSLSQDTATSESRPLMTKRSCTPLAAVSDNESEDDGAPAGQHGDASERTKEEERPTTFLANTVSYLLRQRASPRTAISLDNVDLWEDDDSETEESRQSPQFDVINGVPINPRATIDFSELRRSRSPVANKRNKLNDSKHAAPPPIPTNATRRAEMESSPKRKPDDVSSRYRVFEARTKPRIRHTRQLPATLVVSKPRRPGNGAPTGGGTLLRTMPHGEQPPSPNDRQTSPSSSEFQMSTLSSTYVFSESATVATAVEQAEVQCTSASRGNVRCISLRQANAPCSYVKTSHAKYSQAPSLRCGNDRSTLCTNVKSTKVQLNKPQNINTPSGQDKNRIMSVVKANELNRINSRLKSTNSARNASRDLDTDCLQSKPADDQNPATGPDCHSSADSCTSTGSAATSPERKVKFNNFVTVREGDMNTYGYLRESHDSAQKIKQKYLTGLLCKGRTPKSSVEPEKRRVPDCSRGSPPIEIVF